MAGDDRGNAWQRLTPRDREVQDLASLIEPELEWKLFETCQRLGRVASRILASMAKPWSLSEAAFVAYMSPTYFSSFFSRRLGVSYNRWLRIVRVAAALRLLLTTDLSVARVAAAVGFRSTRNLQRAFRQILGMSARTIKGANTRSQGTYSQE